AKHAQSDLYDRGIKAIPFDLTRDQKAVLEEVRSDLAANHCMNRLLQGDVGSGKTIVAFLAALIPIENGFQVAIMAPTEILARQHYETLKPFAEALGLTIEILTGKDKKPHKTKIYKASAAGEIQVIIGTHALIQEDMLFKNLGFVVIDEQHRFGVAQRLRLTQKGKHVDCLSMTATPIPRTLMLASYGDLDTSQLREKPAGRLPIQTSAISSARLIEVIEGIKRTVAQGDKVYWVCPLVEESEKIDLAAAKERYEFMEQHMPGQVGLIHGKLKPKEKEAVMKLFTQGILTVLVATTVIEVGVDVHDATVMVIEHAERFGLAQLHQLRGRVGRGTKQGHCILLYEPESSEASLARLSIMRQTNDGFEIAEEDWKIRGGGELLGLKQSGLPNFKFVDWGLHQGLLREAVLEAEKLVTEDPLLDTTPKGKAAQNLLYLFDKEETVQYLKA
ncbi:MAG TPA: ATP-dependent DNA helicase RecG, partial [Holosporales bacterium]|nr:ATP-dependent DNA helicase RecG [Holosporales bacterium]